MYETFDLLRSDFEKQQDTIKVTLEGGGSRTGLMAIKDDAVDIGLSSFEFDVDNELGSGHNVVDRVVAFDGIVLVNHDNNPVQQLSNDQVNGIFGGTITDWQELGGPSGAILPIVRNQNSGTQRFFFDYFNIDQPAASAVVADENNEIVQRVLNNQNGIGFIGLSYFAVGVNNVLIPSLDTLRADFIGPSKTSLINGYYPLKRPLRIYHKLNPDAVVSAFLSYLNSDNAVRIMEGEGLIPNNDQNPLSLVSISEN